MRLRHTSVVVVLVAVAACTGRKGPAARDCFGYTMPAGWRVDASKTGADVLLAGPTEFPLGTHSMHDTFIVRFIPGDVSLEDFKGMLIANLTKDNVNKPAKDQQHAVPGSPAINIDAVPKPTFTPITIGGHDGFRLDVRSKLYVDGAPIDTVNTTLFVKFGNDIVDIAAGYIGSREAVMKPVSDAFVASINFDRCK